MKKVCVIICLIAGGFSSCRKEDPSVFDKSPDERLNEIIAGYQGQLSSAQNGWKALIRNDSGRGSVYSFLFKFNNQNRVVMFSDFDSTSAVTPKESSYRLKALQQPSLIFDTYSYLHVLSDPDERVNGGNRGSGLLSDFEFFFDSTTTDTIKLVGRLNGSKLTLVKATKAEEDAYYSGALANGLSINKILTYFKRLTIGGQLYDVRIDPASRQFNFSWVDANGNPQSFTTGYYFVAGGIIFTTPLINGSQTISSFTGITWNPSAETINLTVNNTAATITGIIVPLRIDVGAPKRWWDYAVANGNNYWISLEGFHVNGVDDAFNIGSLVSGTNTYYYLIYWPEYDAGNNDLFGPVFLNAAQTSLVLDYGSAPAKPTFTANGRAIFTELGTYGAYPSTGAAGASRTLLYNASGYYFEQTSETSYDMVSAANGKSWITWIY